MRQGCTSPPLLIYCVLKILAFPTKNKTKQRKKKKKKTKKTQPYGYREDGTCDF